VQSVSVTFVGYVAFRSDACGCETGAVSRVAVADPLLRSTKQVEEVVDLQRPWITIVWNDPVNLMSYVTYVFMNYFKYPRDKAEKLMRDVHYEGRAVVSEWNP
jgi:ATP-dependent Clp protease adapter protein ClpS